MAQFDTQALLYQLETDVQQLLQTADYTFSELSTPQLLQSPEPGQWSIAQCLEHLNAYNRYYVPALQQAIEQGEQQGKRSTSTFRSGWLGNYFTKLMQPRTDEVKAARFQAQKGYIPVTDLDARAVLLEFVAQQQELLHLLHRAKGVDLGRLKVAVSVAKWVKMSAGDTFRFLIAHEQRHMLQAQRVISKLGQLANG